MRLSTLSALSDLRFFCLLLPLSVGCGSNENGPSKENDLGRKAEKTNLETFDLTGFYEDSESEVAKEAVEEAMTLSMEERQTLLLDLLLRGMSEDNSSKNGRALVSRLEFDEIYLLYEAARDERVLEEETGLRGIDVYALKNILLALQDRVEEIPEKLLLSIKQTALKAVVENDRDIKTADFFDPAMKLLIARECDNDIQEIVNALEIGDSRPHASILKAYAQHPRFEPWRIHHATSQLNRLNAEIATEFLLSIGEEIIPHVIDYVIEHPLDGYMLEGRGRRSSESYLPITRSISKVLAALGVNAFENYYEDFIEPGLIGFKDITLENDHHQLVWQVGAMYLTWLMLDMKSSEIVRKLLRSSNPIVQMNAAQAAWLLESDIDAELEESLRSYYLATLDLEVRGQTYITLGDTLIPASYFDRLGQNYARLALE